MTTKLCGKRHELREIEGYPSHDHICGRVKGHPGRCRCGRVPCDYRWKATKHRMTYRKTSNG